MELKEIEQGQQTMDEYIQMFKKATRESRYRERLLVSTNSMKEQQDSIEIAESRREKEVK